MELTAKLNAALARQDALLEEAARLREQSRRVREKFARELEATQRVRLLATATRLALVNCSLAMGEGRPGSAGKVARGRFLATG